VVLLACSCDVLFGSVGSLSCGAALDKAAMANFSSTVPPGTCQLSSDNDTTSFSVYIFRGPHVPFVSGMVTRVLLPPLLPVMSDDGSGAPPPLPGCLISGSKGTAFPASSNCIACCSRAASRRRAKASLHLGAYASACRVCACDRWALEPARRAACHPRAGSCEVKPGMEWNGVLPELELQLNANTAQDCCKYCNNKPECSVWKMCPQTDDR
jgi:hypothetical protein